MYRYVNYPTNCLETDSIFVKSDFEYIYVTYSQTANKSSLKQILKAICFKCAYKGYMYDCKINLDSKFRVRNIKLYAKKVYINDVSTSEHNMISYANYGHGNSTTVHHKKGDYAGTVRFYAFKLRYKKRERTYYKDYLTLLK